MKTKRLKHWRAIVLLGGLLLASTAQAELLGRLPSTPGGTDFQAAYDDVLDITWLTNASADFDTFLTWENQVAWAENLVTLGFDDWRLATVSDGSPATSVFDCSGGTAEACAAAGNELGYMYFHNMDGSGINTGTQLVNGVTLSNIQSFYWSGTESAVFSFAAWSFAFTDGSQAVGANVSLLSGWAVRPGDVGEVPLPAPLILLGSAMLSLRWFRRKTA